MAVAASSNKSVTRSTHKLLGGCVMCPVLRFAAARFSVVAVIAALVAIAMGGSLFNVAEDALNGVRHWADKCSLGLQQAEVSHGVDSYLRAQRDLASVGAQLRQLEKQRADTVEQLSRYRVALENAQRLLREHPDEQEGRVPPSRPRSVLQRDVVRLAARCDRLSADLCQLDKAISAIASQAAAAASRLEASAFAVIEQDKRVSGRTFEHDASHALRAIHRSLNDFPVVGPERDLVGETRPLRMAP
jgi:hypothetical protein